MTLYKGAKLIMMDAFLKDGAIEHPEGYAHYVFEVVEPGNTSPEGYATVRLKVVR